MTVAMRPLVRRLALAPVVVLVVTALTYATPRILRPELYGEHPPPVLSGTAHDVDRALLHFDFGRAAIGRAARTSVTCGCAAWPGTCGCWPAAWRSAWSPACSPGCGARATRARC